MAGFSRKEPVGEIEDTLLQHERVVRWSVPFRDIDELLNGSGRSRLRSPLAGLRSLEIELTKHVEESTPYLAVFIKHCAVEAAVKLPSSLPISLGVVLYGPSSRCIDRASAKAPGWWVQTLTGSRGWRKFCSAQVLLTDSSLRPDTPLLFVLKYGHQPPELGLPATLNPHIPLIAASYNNPKMSDVRFTFQTHPRVRLYAQSMLLRTLPYFDTLLDSDLAAEPAIDFTAPHEVPDDDSDLSDADDVGAVDEDDLSDDELLYAGDVREPPAKRLRSSIKPRMGARRSAGQPSRYRRIHITDFSPKTLATVLFWLSSRDMLFAPLKSSYEAELVLAAGEGRKLPGRDRYNEQKALFVKMPDKLSQHRPSRASPKSILRLCDKLLDDQLEDVKIGALAAILRSLSIDNVVHEAFGPAAQRHDDIRDVTLDFLSEHLPIVADRNDYQEALMSDAVPRSVLVELLQRAAGQIEAPDK